MLRPCLNGRSLSPLNTSSSERLSARSSSNSRIPSSDLPSARRRRQSHGCFHDHCIERYLAGTLDTVTASMAKYWLTDLQGKIIDRCLQFFGGYGYMDEFPISRMYRDARVTRIYAGTNEIMKLLIARSL